MECLKLSKTLPQMFLYQNSQQRLHWLEALTDSFDMRLNRY